MATTPVIESVLSWLSTTIIACTPAVEPGVTFRRSTEQNAIAKLPLKSGKRQFGIDFTGARTESAAEGRGVQTPGLADRRSMWLVEIFYPNPGNELLLERTIASDYEVLARKLEKSSSWSATAIRWARINSARTNRSAADGKAIVLNLEVEILYLDTE